MIDFTVKIKRHVKIFYLQETLAHRQQFTRSLTMKSWAPYFNSKWEDSAAIPHTKSKMMKWTFSHLQKWQISLVIARRRHKSTRIEVLQGKKMITHSLVYHMKKWSWPKRTLTSLSTPILGQKVWVEQFKVKTIRIYWLTIGTQS